ncbi:hypothetical protein SELMODRAFT_410057 [Selaginella moellendorffii]|uniref:Uncharacterized protein n=1 Tax=Selaginella moellendorffii TaxID=88036 RepID=D8RDC1_SELML|nr:hypothetical protein SELMODRAFT_410057 [Selaginella moellendorffii]
MGKQRKITIYPLTKELIFKPTMVSPKSINLLFTYNPTWKRTRALDDWLLEVRLYKFFCIMEKEYKIDIMKKMLLAFQEEMVCAQEHKYIFTKDYITWVFKLSIGKNFLPNSLSQIPPKGLLIFNIAFLVPLYERPNKNTQLAGSDDFELDPTRDDLFKTFRKRLKGSAEVGDVRLTAKSLSRHFLSKQVAVVFLAMEQSTNDGDNDEQMRGVDTSTLKSSCWRTCEG